MTAIVDKVVSGIMDQVSREEVANPGRRAIHYFFTVTKPEEVAAGPEIVALFSERLDEYYPGAEIDCRGYGANPYNIKASIRRNVLP